MVEGFDVLYLQSSCQCPRNIRALVYLFTAQSSVFPSISFPCVVLGPM